VNVPTVLPLFVTVIVALLTVGIVGLPDKSEYAPLVATVASVGLFSIFDTPLFEFQSEFTCAAGIVGLSDRSLYDPEVATVASDGAPLKSE
jgi:hypothetical protein